MMKNIMRLCIQEAVNGVNKGEGGPFGAVILKDGEVVDRKIGFMPKGDLQGAIESKF